MTLFGAFASSTFGMMAQSHALHTIGTNVANITTGGYKKTETRFSTVLSDTIGHDRDFGGVTPKDLQNISQQGLITASDSNLDLAINGHGFFILNTERGGNGKSLYTRDGAFDIKTGPNTSVTGDDGNPITVKEGYLADKNGHYIQGWTANPATGIFNTSLSSLRIDQFAFSNAGKVTSKVEINANLPSTATTGETSKTDVEFFDSLGNPFSTSLAYTKSQTPNNWDLGVAPPIGVSVATIRDSAGNVYDSRGQLEFTARPTDGAYVTIEGTTYEFDTNSLPALSDAVAQVDTVTIAGTVEAGDSYSVTVGGNAVTYNVTGAEANIGVVRDNLVAAINADATVGAIVTAAAGTPGQLTLTANATGTPFVASAATVDISVAQISTVTIAGNVDAGDIVRATINGTNVNYTVAPGDITVNDIRDGLVAAINLNPVVNGAVTATPTAGGIVTITSDTAGTAFTIASSTPTDPGANTTATPATPTANVPGTADNAAGSVITTVAVSGLRVRVDISTNTTLAQDVTALVNAVVAQDSDFDTTNNRIVVDPNNSTNVLFHDDGTRTIIVDPSGLTVGANTPAKQTSTFNVLKRPPAFSPYAQLTFAANMNVGDAMVIDGITYTFINGAGGPLDVDRSGTLATTLANLETAIETNDINLSALSGRVRLRDANNSGGNNTLILGSLADASYTANVSGLGAITEPDGTAFTTPAAVPISTGHGIVFDDSGLPGSFNAVTLDLLGFTNGAANIGGAGATTGVTLDLGSVGVANGLTQFAGEFTPGTLSQDGFSASDMRSFEFDNLGQVVANFGNGTFRPVYKIPLAVFSNANSLHAENGNAYSETQESGKRRVVAAGVDGYALFSPNSNELSNVDLADEFTRMIQTQAAYNSSATVFKTVDEMLVSARDLKR
jgi:flagellar hook-basal body protein